MLALILDLIIAEVCILHNGTKGLFHVRSHLSPGLKDFIAISVCRRAVKAWCSCWTRYLIVPKQALKCDLELCSCVLPCTVHYEHHQTY